MTGGVLLLPRVIEELSASEGGMRAAVGAISHGDTRQVTLLSSTNIAGTELTMAKDDHK